MNILMHMRKKDAPADLSGNEPAACGPRVWWRNVANIQTNPDCQVLVTCPRRRPLADRLTPEIAREREKRFAAIRAGSATRRPEDDTHPKAG